MSQTPYERFGGAQFFEDLVADFYAQVEHDPILRPMYPPGDLAPARRRLTLFLAQYWGGPTTYSDERGHPRLRARHIGFDIDSTARDRWLALMRTALDARQMDPADERELWAYLTGAAIAMQNIADDAPPHGSMEASSS